MAQKPDQERETRMKAGEDHDMLIMLASARKRLWLSIGVATLTSLWLAACAEPNNGAPLPDGSAGTSGGTMGGFGGAPASDSGVDGDATAPQLYLGAVVAANGVYVATGVLDGDFGSDSVILTSGDGTTWTLRYRSGDEDVDSVAYGDGHWVAAGWGAKEVGTDIVRSRSVLVSEDATTWRTIASPESEGFHEIIWTGTEFLMTGELSSSWGLWSSPTGSAWTERMIGSIPGQLASGAPGIVGSSSGAVVFSDDSGVNWSSFAIDPANLVLGLWPEAGGFGGTAVNICCFGEQPSSNRYYSMHSNDGRVWDLQQAVDADPIPKAVAQRGETWVGISAKDGGLLYRNAETSVWTASPDRAIAVAVTAGDRFVAVGDGIWSSEDGKTWTPATLPTEIARH